MEHFEDLASKLFGGMTAHEGECPIHGKRFMYVPRTVEFTEWRCSECSMIAHSHAEDIRRREERTEWLLHVSQVPKKYRGERFKATTAAHKAVRGIVKAFSDTITAERSWAALVLVGAVGTGKTLLASELAEALIKNHSITVRYCTAKQMIAEIQSSYGVDGKSEEGEILRFVQFDLLILDEIDAKRDTDSANLLLTEVINRRYNEEKPVAVITNQSFNGLAEFVGTRVDDRLHENSFVCSFDWPSFRRQ
jgi:DNA replication protein DnaC